MKAQLRTNPNHAGTVDFTVREDFYGYFLPDCEWAYVRAGDICAEIPREILFAYFGRLLSEDHLLNVVAEAQHLWSVTEPAPFGDWETAAEWNAAIEAQQADVYAELTAYAKELELDEFGE